jgi:hypothetical protein
MAVVNRVADSLEIIEDCAGEDLEDEIIPSQKISSGPKRPF